MSAADIHRVGVGGGAGSGGSFEGDDDMEGRLTRAKTLSEHLHDQLAVARLSEAERVVAGRTGPWLAVRAPAVYGPGDRETLAYFRTAACGLAPRPWLNGACLALIHVEDLAEVLAAEPAEPGFTLMNVLAQERAKALVASGKDFF